MEKDLKWIKKHYGEQMMHLCREHFQSILETEGYLPKLLNEHFIPSKSLAKDIIKQGKVNEFVSYIFSLTDIKTHQEVDTKMSAVEMLKQAGYTLFPECKTEEDIQSFKKYYAQGEELCTFGGGRLNTCRVWFTVKENAEELDRSSFKNPSRQDEYGTSVISIQFTKANNILSIKNRYNHTVNNPDNTFNSNLDNMVKGLSSAFYADYNVKSTNKSTDFELDDYIEADGKFYKYNYEENNIYYCCNNIVIDNFKVKKIPDHQMLLDRYIFDFKEKTVSGYSPDNKEKDSFLKTVEHLKEMLFKDNVITLTKSDGGSVKIVIDENRRIISLTDYELVNCETKYMYYWKYIKEITLPKLEQCGNFCFLGNTALTDLNLPQLKQCGHYCFGKNEHLVNLNLPKLEQFGEWCFDCNTALTDLNLPKLEQCGDRCFWNNSSLTNLNLPQLEQCGYDCFTNNPLLKSLNAELLNANTIKR